MEISEFVKNTKIEIRITDGPDWNKYLVFGETKPFELMNPHKEDIVQTENKTIYFFPKNMDEFYLTMKCGLKFDKDIQTENLTLSMYNGVYFPDNNYYNSDVLPIEWMEIFEKKEYLNELEEKSEITTLFDPNCTKQQLDYVQETDSFLNKTILKIDSDKQTLSKRPKSSVDFIRMNKNIIKSLNQSPTLIHSKIDIKSSRNQPRIIDELKKSYKTARTLNLNIMDKRITEEFYEDEKLSKNIDIENKLKPLVLKNNDNSSSKFKSIFKSRNLHENVILSGKLMNSFNNLNGDKELSSKKFYRTLYNNSTFQHAGTTRPVSAIENNYNSNTKISENSKDSFIEAENAMRIIKPNYGITQRYEIPEKYKHRRRFKRKSKPFLWQYKEDQVKLLKEEPYSTRPISAKLYFKNNLRKRKELKELFELVKRPNDLSSYNFSQVTKNSKKSKNYYLIRPKTSNPIHRTNNKPTEKRFNELPIKNTVYNTVNDISNDGIKSK